MTGKINLLNQADSSGLILSDSGARIRFESSEVFSYDIGRIAVGQLVTFDLKAGRVPEATNVCPQRSHALLDSKGNLRRAELQTRYLGFEHEGSIRSYRFELSSSGEEMQTVIFRIDLQVLRTARIPIQDGPALCRHGLLARQIVLDPEGSRLRQFVLDEKDAFAYRASLPVREERKYTARKPIAAAAAATGLPTT